MHWMESADEADIGRDSIEPWGEIWRFWYGYALLLSPEVTVHSPNARAVLVHVSSDRTEDDVYLELPEKVIIVNSLQVGYVTQNGGLDIVIGYDVVDPSAPCGPTNSS